MPNKNIARRWCITPGCNSSNIKNPEKLFFQIPLDAKRRTAWIKAVRRNPTDFSKISCIFVCEDHFNIEEDMENYIKFKIMGGPKKMKVHVVPHIFACQLDRKRAAPKIPRKVATKRARQQLVNDILENNSIVAQPSTSAYVATDTEASTSNIIHSNFAVPQEDSCSKFLHFQIKSEQSDIINEIADNDNNIKLEHFSTENLIIKKENGDRINGYYHSKIGEERPDPQLGDELSLDGFCNVKQDFCSGGDDATMKLENMIHEELIIKDECNLQEHANFNSTENA